MKKVLVVLWKSDPTKFMKKVPYIVFVGKIVAPNDFHG